MKKKSLLTMVASLALVGALGVGATLAYLTSTTQEVENTFVFAQEGISISLDEAKVDANNKAIDGERDSDGQEYANLVPGMVIDKDPTVYVNENSLDCNVFVSIKNPNALSATTGFEEIEMSNAWDVVEVDGDTTYYVYNGNGAESSEKDADDNYFVVGNSEVKQTLEALFTKVVVKDDATKDNTFDAIVVKAAAVQADSCSDDAAWETAKGMLAE